MKKAMALFLSLLLALGILPALAEEPVTLTYATFSAAGAQEETLAKMIDRALRIFPCRRADRAHGGDRVPARGRRAGLL